MLTRLQKKNNLGLALYKSKVLNIPIWVSISDFYHSFYNDYVHFILSHHNKKPFEYSFNKDKQFFSHCYYHEKIPCFYMENVRNSVFVFENIVKRNYEACFNLSFSDKKCRVRGRIELLMSGKGISRMMPVDILDHNKWFVCFFKTGEKLSAYQEWKIKACIRYFKLWYKHEKITVQIEFEKVLLVNPDSKHVAWYNVFIDKKTDTIIKNQCQWIRHAKKYAPVIPIHNEKYQIQPRLLPNMKKYNDNYVKEKMEMAVSRGEISLLWYCTDKIRNLAFSKNIYSFRDLRFIPEVIEPNFCKEKSFIIKKMISMNMSSDNEWIYIHHPEDARLKIDPKKYLYADFEYDMDEKIYLIGIYNPENGEYTGFWSDNVYSPVEEEKLLYRFTQFLKNHRNKSIMYWYADKNVLEKAFDRHSFPNDIKNEWTDLWNIFRYTPIIVKDAFNFSLKSIVKSYHKYGECPIHYQELECHNGLESLTMMKKYYTEKNEDAKKSLEKYNHIDCESLFHIYRYIFCQKN